MEEGHTGLFWQNCLIPVLEIIRFRWERTV